MTQNYKPAYPPEFRQQIGSFGQMSQATIQGIWLPLHFDTIMVPCGGRTLWIKPGNCPGFGIERCFLE